MFQSFIAKHQVQKCYGHVHPLALKVLMSCGFGFRVFVGDIISRF